MENGWQDNYPLRDQLIAEYIPYVKNIAHRIAVHLPPVVDVDDLINAGVIGLMDAIERYDPSMGNKFITYGACRIRGAVLSELRSRDHFSRSDRSKIRELEKTYEEMEKTLGREVKDVEVADELEIGLDEFYQIRKMSSTSFVGFDEIGDFSKEEKDGFLSSFVDGSGEDPLSLARVKELSDSIAEAIEALPEKEKLVISLYYWDELTMKEIGKVLDITESRVSQIHSKAVIHLKAKLKKKGLMGA